MKLPGSSKRFFDFFFATYPWRTVSMITLMFVASVVEGFGVIVLVPILDLTDQTQEVDSEAGRMVLDALGKVGLEPTLGNLLFAIVVMICLKAILLYLANRQIGNTTAEVAKELRLRLIRTLLSANWDYVGTKSVGRYAYVVNNEIARSSQAFREACQLITALLQFMSYAAVSLILAWQITLAAAVAGIVLTFMLGHLFSMSRAAGKEQSKHHRELAARLSDVLQGIKPLKAMAKEELVWPLLANEAEGLNQAQRKQVSASAGLRLFQEPFMTAHLATGLFVLLGLRGEPLAKVIPLALVFYRMMGSVNQIQSQYRSLLAGLGLFDAFTDELAEAEAQIEHVKPVSSRIQLEDALEIRDLWFSYGAHEVLRGIDLNIPVGRFVSLTGESGCGKTTLADLIVGLRAPDRGTILVDGVDLQSLDAKAWRGAIGYVPQELLLFNDTILQNITLGDESITREQAEYALELAGAIDFVRNRSEGLDAMVGERGGLLSGGQRQRISIARALVWDPSLLILDEVTTALDPSTEQAICKTLGDLAGRVTILSISHQPAMREVADVTYSMANGGLASATPLATAR